MAHLRRQFREPVALAQAVMQPFEEKPVDFPAPIKPQAIRRLMGSGKFGVKAGKMAKMGG